jgi:hypothetical protein
LETGVLVLLLHCKYSCIVGDRSFSAAAALKIFLYCWRPLKLLSPTIQEHLQCSSSTKTPVSNNTGKFTVLLLHCTFSCIVGDKSFSAAAAL